MVGVQAMPLIQAGPRSFLVINGIKGAAWDFAERAKSPVLIARPRKT